MTPIILLWLVLGSTWVIFEMLLSRRHRADNRATATATHDHGSFRLLWLVTLASLLIALWLTDRHGMPIGWDEATRQYGALTLFGCGIGLRLWAIASLGRFFDARVTLHDQHSLVCSGPYRWIRHPSYTGLLLAFLASGLAMGDWLALGALFLPIALAVHIRIRIEEQVLSSRFGAAYAEYSRRTRKLVPGVY